MVVQFHVLGPVEVRAGLQVLDVGHARQRFVLAALLVDANRPVAADVLVERVWSRRIPRHARTTLSGYLSRLRQVLAAADGVQIVRRAGGYLLTADPMAVDLHRFRALLDRAGTAAPDQAATALYTQALELWRGEPLATLDTPWANALRAGLQEERHTAELDRRDRELRCGRHAALLPELSAQAPAHPLDERLAGQLMLALYRCGRQADALARYEGLRRRLADELGTDPSPPLQRLYEQILRADVGLSAPATPAARSRAAARLPPRTGPAPAPVRPHPAQLSRTKGSWPGAELPVADAVVLGGAGRKGPGQLATGAAGAAAGGTARSAGTMAFPAGPALVGRDRELGALAAAAAAAAEGAFRIVWIAGEAGSGKSALGAAVTSMLGGRGWATAWGGSPEVDGVPSGWAWADVVRQLMNGRVDPGHTAAGDELDDGVRALLDRKGSAAGPPEIAPFWVARAVVEVLGRATDPAGRRARPVLVLLDDVHRAGEETLQILRYACTELARRSVLVVATFRPTEVSAALEATRAALIGPRVDQLDLAGLGEADVGRLLTARTVAAVTPDHVALIAARTGGNPLFVGETARLIDAEGPDAAIDLVPAGVGDVLRRRLAALPPAAQAVLRTAAVIGTEVDTDLLLGPNPGRTDAVLDALEAAIRAGLLTERTPPTVRFSHVLLRDVIYRDIPQVRRRHLHAEVLTALERSRPGDVAALAHHALAAATPITARSAAVRAAAAARAASASNGHQEATGLLRRALAVLDTTGQTGESDRDLPGQRPWADPAAIDGLRLDLLCALVSAQGRTGNVRAARASRDHAIQVAGRLGDNGALARAYAAYDAPALWAMREYRQLDRALVNGLATTLAAIPADQPATRCRLLAALALEIEADDPDRTDRVSAEAVAIAHRLDDPELLCRALNARYRYVATLGPDGWPELVSIGQRQLTVATAAGLDAYQTQAHHILCMACLARSDLEQAQWHLDRAVEHAASGQLGLAVGILAMFTGLRELVTGQFERAERTFAGILARLRAVGNPSVAETELLVRFCIEHARQGPGSRERMAELAEQSRPTYERLGDAVAEPYVRTLIAAGQLERARAIWNPDVPLSRDHYWFRWTVLRAENALHLGDLGTAETCYHQLLPWAGHLPGLLHAHITLGPVDQTLGDLAAALARPGAARHYADAIALAERIGAAHWAERSREALRGTDVDDRDQASSRLTRSSIVSPSTSAGE